MTRMLRVLYVHPFAAHGGATKSLVEMIRALPLGSVRGTAIAPAGAAAELLAAAGLEVILTRGIAQWDDTRFGHYRRLRWLILLREFAYWPATLWGLREAIRRGPYDLIHCNEVTALLPCLIAKRILHVPLIVHVRSLQRAGGDGRISARLRRLIRDGVDAVVAIDEAVRRTLPADMRVDLIHNGMAVPSESLPRVADDRFCVGIIGALHRSKGVYEAVEAARLLRDRGVHVRLLVVGENVHRLSGLRGWVLRRLDFARDVRSDLETYVAKHSLQQVVEFTGFVADLRPIYGRIDAVCFPSHLDAPGRPVFEAALFGRPAIVAMRNPTSDVVAPGRTGLCIDEPTPVAIAHAIEALARNRAAAEEMGVEARRAALLRFDSRVSASKMLELYRRVCSRGLAAPSGIAQADGSSRPPSSP
jgi:glycosyltransferase involved in cell wall biosynthesis